MSKLLHSKVFRFLVCFLLIGCILVNISPLRAEAFAVEAATVSAIGLTLFLYLYWTGFVVPPPDIGVYQQLDDSFRHYLDDLGIDESSWVSDADDLDDEWDNSDSSDSSESGSTLINVGQTLRNLFKIFITGGLVKGSIDLFPDIEDAQGSVFYHGVLFPKESMDSLEKYPYVAVVESGTELSLWLCQLPLKWYPKNSMWSGQKAGYNGANGVYKYVVSDGIWVYNTHFGCGYFGGEWDNSIVLWTDFDILNYKTNEVHFSGSEPVTVENEFLVPSAVLGSIAGGIQAGTITEDDYDLPPNLDISSVIKSGISNYHEDMVQAAQDLIDGKISHEDFQEQLAYNENAGENIPGVNDPIVNPDDPGGETTPGTGTDPWEPPSDPGAFALDLSKVFPFCIPFDLYAFLTCLNADPVAPVIQWELALPGGGSFPIELDLSPFNSVAQLLRRLQLLLFCVALAIKTRDLIKG